MRFNTFILASIVFGSAVVALGSGCAAEDPTQLTSDQQVTDEELRRHCEARDEDWADRCAQRSSRRSSDDDDDNSAPAPAPKPAPAPAPAPAPKPAPAPAPAPGACACTCSGDRRCCTLHAVLFRLSRQRQEGFVGLVYQERHQQQQRRHGHARADDPHGRAARRHRRCQVICLRVVRLFLALLMGLVAFVATTPAEGYCRKTTLSDPSETVDPTRTGKVRPAFAGRLAALLGEELRRVSDRGRPRDRGGREDDRRPRDRDRPPRLAAWDVAQCPSVNGGTRPVAIRTVDVAQSTCTGRLGSVPNEVRFTNEPLGRRHASASPT